MECPTCNTRNSKYAIQCRNCGALLPRKSSKMLHSMTLNPGISVSLGLALLMLGGIMVFNGAPWLALLPLLVGVLFITIGLQMR